MSVKKKIVWLVVSGLMALSLVLASCAPKVTEETRVVAKEGVVTEKAVVAKEGAEMVVDDMGQLVPKPQYGGVFTYQAGDPLGFDAAYSPIGEVKTVYLTNSMLLNGDWAKGTAGTGETDWQFGIAGQVSLLTGDLATGWELVLPDTIIFHLREGVKWQNKPPVNGREFTADDVVYSLTRIFLEAKGSTLYGRFAGVGTPPKSIKALDTYTVEVKVPPELLGNMVVMMGSFTHIVPREVIEKYGDMKDWRNSVGTGAWMLKDYVSGSSTTFVRNPDYFMNDPLHPGNQLPYLDGVLWLNIPDRSTEQAAFRTGKIDRMTGLDWEDQPLFMKQRPELKYKEKLASSPLPVGRQDKPELPFKDIRVRQALNLAVDKQAILKDYYGGRGVLLALPVPPTPAHAKLFTPLDEQPSEPTIPGSRASVQELFTYNPEKAKQLLTEAGYPNGFKTQIIAKDDQVDFLAIVREDLLKVGVDMAIKPLESTVFTTQWKGRSFPEMMASGSYEWNYPQTMTSFIVSSENPAFFNYDNSDTHVNEAYKVVVANVGINDDLWQKTLKELYPYLLEQASLIWMPAYYSYTMWWPWVGNYHGETNVGYSDSSRFLQYIWVDGALKKSMGY